MERTETGVDVKEDGRSSEGQAFGEKSLPGDEDTHAAFGKRTSPESFGADFKNKNKRLKLKLKPPL